AVGQPFQADSRVLSVLTRRAGGVSPLDDVRRLQHDRRALARTLTQPASAAETLLPPPAGLRRRLAQGWVARQMLKPSSAGRLESLRYRRGGTPDAVLSSSSWVVLFESRRF